MSYLWHAQPVHCVLGSWEAQQEEAHGTSCEGEKLKNIDFVKHEIKVHVISALLINWPSADMVSMDNARHYTVSEIMHDSASEALLAITVI